MSTVRLESPGRVVVEGQLDLTTLMAFKREVDLNLPSGRDLTVDFSKVVVTDSAALALLVYLVRRARLAGDRILVEGIGPRLEAMIDLAGIDGLLLDANAPVSA